MPLRLTFYGGAETVTGSNFMVTGEQGKLLVDCGIEQGRDFVEAEMYAPFPYDVPSLDAVVITHAHLDHVGRLPKLVHEGFKGTVYMTEPTKDITELLLRDSVGILAQEARRLQREALYVDSDIDALMARVKTVPYHEEFLAAPGLSCYFRNTGHILGSASVRIKDLSDGTAVAFTGDIGNSPAPLLPDAEAIPDADAILMESVYGDRLNTEKENRVPELLATLKRAIARGGAILMPAFSIERTQLMLYEISNFMDAGQLPKIQVFLDSPLAIKVTEVYEKWGSTYFKPAAQDELKREHDLFKFPFLTETLSREESQKIAEAPNPKIIMAGAGMSHGGRIGHWEQQYLSDPNTTLMIVGYQAPGSPGRMLQDGAPQVMIEGREVKLRAKVETFSGWSGHADRDGLVAFAKSCTPTTKTFFIGLGEPASSRFLAQRIHDFVGARAIVAEKGQSWDVSKMGVTKAVG